MGLLDILRSGVSLAKSVTADLQASVTHESCISVSGSGVRNYGVPVSRPAIVVKKQQLVKTSTGEMVMSQAYITFLDSTLVTELDRITLPDGSTGPILNTEGFVDRGLGRNLLTEIYLG